MFAPRLALTLLVVLAFGCGSRSVQPFSDGEPPAAPDASPRVPPPGIAVCDVPAQLVAAAAAVDGAVTVVREVSGWIGMASSGAAPGGTTFANHNVEVLFVLDDGTEVRAHVALDRVLEVGETVTVDPSAPGFGGVAIQRGGDFYDSLSTVEGDTFSGRATVARRSEHGFTASFCLLAWRGGSSRASFTWAHANLPETAFSDL